MLIIDPELDSGIGTSSRYIRIDTEDSNKLSMPTTSKTIEIALASFPENCAKGAGLYIIIVGPERTGCC
jgi:hypothetical protein